MTEIDHEYTSELVCPYCGHPHEDDGEMNEAGDHQCSSCDKHFKYEVDYSVSYTSRQVPCMNGEPHNWKTEPYPGFPEYKRCKACDKREPGPRTGLLY
jgi:hypothetical protein